MASKTSFAVLVKVSDVNDNVPIFSRTIYNVSVNELISVGSVVFDQLETYDADSGQNALVEYFAVPGEGGIVSVKHTQDDDNHYIQKILCLWNK